MAASSRQSHVFACAALLLLLHLVLADANQEQILGSPAPAPSPRMSPIDCGNACAARCAVASRQNLCKKACGSCCARCSCVPPGTSGNKDVCPCYASVTTHGGRPKCP